MRCGGVVVVTCFLLISYTPSVPAGWGRPNPSWSWRAAGCPGVRTGPPPPTAAARPRPQRTPPAGRSSRGWAPSPARPPGRSCSSGWCHVRWSCRSRRGGQWWGVSRGGGRCDLRGEAQHADVLPDVPAVEELWEGQVGAWGGVGGGRGGDLLRLQLCNRWKSTASSHTHKLCRPVRAELGSGNCSISNSLFFLFTSDFFFFFHWFDLWVLGAGDAGVEGERGDLWSSRRPSGPCQSSSSRRMSWCRRTSPSGAASGATLEKPQECCGRSGNSALNPHFDPLAVATTKKLLGMENNSCLPPKGWQH